MGLWIFRMKWIIRLFKKVFLAPLTVDIDKTVNGAIDKETQYLCGIS